jgi:hypothetical protein
VYTTCYKELIATTTLAIEEHEFVRKDEDGTGGMG